MRRLPPSCALMPDISLHPSISLHHCQGHRQHSLTQGLPAPLPLPKGCIGCHSGAESEARRRGREGTITFVFRNCTLGNFLWVTLGVFILSIRENVTAPPSINPELPNLSHRSNLGVIVTSLTQLSGKLHDDSVSSNDPSQRNHFSLAQGSSAAPAWLVINMDWILNCIFNDFSPLWRTAGRSRGTGHQVGPSSGRIPCGCSVSGSCWSSWTQN